MKIKRILILAISLFVTFFFSAGMSFAENAMFVDSEGNVGIGSESPDYKLHVNGDTFLDGNVKVDTQGGATAFYATRSGAITQGLKVYATDRTLYTTYIEDSGESSPGNWRFTNSLDGGTVYEFMTSESDGDLEFNSGQMFIDYSTGDVGIGTSSPSYRLDVYENDSAVAIYGTNTRSGKYNYGVFGKATGSGVHNVGVKGHAVGDDGVYNYGVIGKAEGDGCVNYGVYGSAANGTVNWAGYFNGNVYGAGYALFDYYYDHTPFYKGDALSEIEKISGINGELDHSTLPEFANVSQEVPVFEKFELKEISSGDAFETVVIETEKVVETTNENGDIVKRKVQKGVKKELKGYQVVDGEIVAVTEEIPIFETETIEKKQLRSDVYLDEKTGKVYQKTGSGEVFEKDGRIYQQNQTGTEIEEQRDIGAMVSILTVAIQQLDQKNGDLEAENMELKDRLAKIESIIAKMDTGQK